MFQLSVLGDIISPDAPQTQTTVQEAPVEQTPIVEPAKVEETVEQVIPADVDETKEADQEVEEAVYTEQGDGNFINALSPFAKFLEEQGFISLKDEEGKDITFKDFDELANSMKASIDKSRYDGLNDAQKRYIEALKEGIPLNEVETLEREYQSVNSISEETLIADNQLTFDIICQDLIDKGFDKEKAIKFGNTLMKDKDEAVKEAKAYLESRKKSIVEKYTSLKEKTVEENKVNLESINKAVKERKDVLGVEFNEEFKTKVVKSMTTSAGHNATGQPMNAFDKWRADNGADAEVMLHALMIYTNNFTNLNKIENRVKSSAVEDLNKVLKGQPSKAYKEDDNQRGINIDGKIIKLL